MTKLDWLKFGVGLAIGKFALRVIAKASKSITNKSESTIH